MSKAREVAKLGEVMTNGQIGGRKNIIINGAMQISQRATSATSVLASTAVIPACDRWMFEVSGSNTSGRLHTVTINRYHLRLFLFCKT